jgi:hypothetical protein
MSTPSPQKKKSLFTENTSHLILFMEITGVACEHCAERIHSAIRMYV